MVRSCSIIVYRSLIWVTRIEQYLQSPLQLAHACELLLESELFAFHSERMCDILVDDVRSVSNLSIPISSLANISFLSILRRTQIRIHNLFFTMCFCVMAGVTLTSFALTTVGKNSSHFLLTMWWSRWILTLRILTLGWGPVRVDIVSPSPFQSKPS